MFIIIFALSVLIPKRFKFLNEGRCHIWSVKDDADFQKFLTRHHIELTLIGIPEAALSFDDIKNEDLSLNPSADPL